MNSYESPNTKPLYRSTQILWYVLGILEAILAFRFILKLMGANPMAAFTSFIYNITQPFVAPFLSVFGITHVEGSTFEWTTLLAMIVYWLIVVAIVRLLIMSKPISRIEAAAKLEDQE